MNQVLGCVAVGLMAGTLGCGIAVADDAAARPARDGSSARAIIDHMAEVYKSCESYSDSGVVRTTFFKKAGKRVDEKPFTTAFVRPERFRFEFRSTFPGPWAKPMRYIIWANGRDVRIWWDVRPGVRKKASLSLALAGAGGVSGGSAHTVPALLMPGQVRGRRLTDLRQLERIEDADLNGVRCFRIRGRYDVPGMEPFTIWISQGTLLILRIDWAKKFPDFRTETTTTYKPEVNGAVNEMKLAFGAPKSAN